MLLHVSKLKKKVYLLMVHSPQDCSNYMCNIVYDSNARECKQCGRECGGGEGCVHVPWASCCSCPVCLAMEAAGTSAGRNTRYMMEGVGARVIRGPDWKWGKQVCVGVCVNLFPGDLARRPSLSPRPRLSCYDLWHVYWSEAVDKILVCSCAACIIVLCQNFSQICQELQNIAW